MGQTYSVYADIRFKDDYQKISFCESVKAKIRVENATFDLTRGDLNDPYGCFKVMTRNAEINDDGTWSAFFDASYGWVRVMYDVFRESLNCASDESTVIISTDNEKIIITVKYGEVLSNW